MTDKVTEKYYCTIFTVEVLSNEPMDGFDQMFGVSEDCSVVFTSPGSVEVSRERMAELLVAQGSDPGFLIFGGR